MIVSILICFGKIVLCHVFAKSYVITLLLVSIDSHYQVTKTFSITKLTKYEGKQLIPATKELHILITSVFTYEIVEVIPVKK